MTSASLVLEASLKHTMPPASSCTGKTPASALLRPSAEQGASDRQSGMLPSRALSVKWSQSPVSASSSLSALAEVRPELLHSGALPLVPLPVYPGPCHDLTPCEPFAPQASNATFMQDLQVTAHHLRAVNSHHCQG